MNKLKGHTTYLIGPIDEVKDHGADWRKRIKPFLWSMGMGVFDPCDKPIGLSEDSVVVEQIASLKKQGRFHEAREIMKGIVNIDLTLLDLSTIPIMYIDKEVHMCGSYSEATYAALEKKSCIVVVKQGRTEVPNWILGLMNPDLFFDSFEQAEHYLSEVNAGSVVCPKLPMIDFDKVFGRVANVVNAPV